MGDRRWVVAVAERRTESGLLEETNHIVRANVIGIRIVVFLLFAAPLCGVPNFVVWLSQSAWIAARRASWQRRID